MHHRGDLVRRALALGAAAAAALALAGCADDAEPAPTSMSRLATSPTPTASPLPSPSPDPTPTLPTELADVTVAPTPPAALRGPATDENAAAVAEYYISLFPYMFATGESDAWEKLAGPSCGYCAGVLDELRKDQALDRHSEGGNIEVQATDAWTADSEEYFASVTFIEHPSRTVDESGEVVEDFPETRHTRAELVLEWDGSRWIVSGVDPNLIEIL